MHKRITPKLPRLIGRFSLLMVYTAFFAVQVLCYHSFAKHPEANADNYNIPSILKEKPAKHNISVAVKKASVKFKSFRLNKRFHPETIPSLTYTIEPSMPMVIAFHRLEKPEDYLLIASILSASLRGPPAAGYTV